METIKENRLFRRTYYKGKKQVCGELVLYYLENNLNKNVFGITVSKKLGKAIVRNKIRRRLREIIRQCDNLKEGYFIVVVARSAAVNADYFSLKKSLEELFVKAELLK